jgi:hypothetical protein
MNLTLRPTWQVLKKVRGRRVPGGRTIKSDRDKARCCERRVFRQHRRDLETS